MKYKGSGCSGDWVRLGESKMKDGEFGKERRNDN